MQRRVISFSSSALANWYAVKAAALRELTELMLASPERDELLREADRCDRDARTASYLKSYELKPPT